MKDLETSTIKKYLNPVKLDARRKGLKKVLGFDGLHWKTQAAIETGLKASQSGDPEAVYNLTMAVLSVASLPPRRQRRAVSRLGTLVSLQSPSPSTIESLTSAIVDAKIPVKRRASLLSVVERVAITCGSASAFRTSADVFDDTVNNDNSLLGVDEILDSACNGAML